jgi:chemotaxis protein histidine kinase CheA
VRDVNGNGGPRCIYRLHVAEKTKSPNYALKVTEDSHTLEPGRTSIFKVEALRDGYDGPIDLAFDHLPDGIKLTGQTIPAQATGTLLTLSSDKPMPPVITALKGRAKDRKDDEALAQFDSNMLGKFQPWLDRELALAGAPKSEIPFTVTSETKSKTIPLSGKLSVIVKCTRSVGHDGPVRLTLLTSQARIFLKGAVDPARNLREDKVVLIEDDKNAQAAFDAVTAAKTAVTKAEATLATAKKAEEAVKKAAEAANEKAGAATANVAKAGEAEAAKAKTAADAATKAAATAATASAASTKAVTDAAKALTTTQAAIATTEKAAADAALKAKNDVEVTLVVPPDLVEVPHQIAFKAELLKRDRRTVEAIAYTPVQSIPVINPIVVKATPLAAVKLDAKAGATADLVGQIERLEGAKGDVAVTLAGLPAGVTATPATLNVKAAETQFKFALKFPATYKPAEATKLTVSATAKPYGTIQTKSRDAVVALNVLPADPLPATPPPAATPPAKPPVTAVAKPTAPPAPTPVSTK